MQQSWKTIPRFNIPQRMTINDDPNLKQELFFMEGLYNQVLAYMTQEMNKNTQSETFKNLQTLNIVELATKLYELFRSGGEWDHKPMLQKLTLPVITRSYSKKLFVTPIRGDNRYLYYYDIWSNIHYGYVLEKLGFMEELSKGFAGGYGILEAYGNAQNKKTEAILQIFSGKQTLISALETRAQAKIDMANKMAAEAEDNLSIEIGQRLARQSGQHLESQELHNIIFNQRLYWDEGEIRYRWETLKLYER